MSKQGKKKTPNKSSKNNQKKKTNTKTNNSKKKTSNVKGNTNKKTSNVKGNTNKKTNNVSKTSNKVSKNATRKVEKKEETVIKEEVKKEEVKKEDKVDVKEEKPKKSKKNIILIVLGIILFLILLCTILFFILFGLKESVTLEAGIKEIKISDFYKHDKVIYETKFITDVKKIDLKKVSSYNIKLKVGKKTKTIKLKIVDTTKPKVKFKDYYANIDYQINPEDFIESVSDVSETKVEVLNNIVINGYNDYKVKVQVSDKYNNKVTETRTLRIAMSRQEVIKELGSPLTKEDILYNVKETGDFINQEEIDNINKNGVGEYEIIINANNLEFKTKIIVQDTTPPNMELQNVKIYDDQKVESKDKFIKSITDASNEFETTMKTEIDYTKLGDQEIIIEAVDKYGNKIEKKATLSIIQDKVAPTFKGLYNITVNKYTKINYNSGVSAYDEKDGNVTFTVDTSRVNVNAYGTYYATYTAHDKAGNVKTAKRKITVNHDAADRNAKIDAALNKSGRGYEQIRQYIMNNVRYSSNGGGSDKVWYGLTSFQGNCVVHAYLYQAMLQRAGYNAKIIYTTDQTHYWVLVNINGVWRHSDATPTDRHRMISAATDAERLEHLQGRDWNHNNWPAAL